MTKIRLKKAWNGMAAGREIETSDGVAIELIRRGFAEDAEPVRVKRDNKSMTVTRGSRDNANA